eukprot:scaffold111689_cov36-Phaeocystis_antarctica.AAC.1
MRCRGPRQQATALPALHSAAPTRHTPLNRPRLACCSGEGRLSGRGAVHLRQSPRPEDRDPSDPPGPATPSASTPERASPQAKHSAHQARLSYRGFANLARLTWKT